MRLVKGNFKINIKTGLVQVGRVNDILKRYVGAPRAREPRLSRMGAVSSIGVIYGKRTPEGLQRISEANL